MSERNDNQNNKGGVVVYSGQLVEIKDEVGTYILVAYDKVNKQWGFVEYGKGRHSCHGGYTKSKNIKPIKAVKGSVKG